MNKNFVIVALLVVVAVVAGVLISGTEAEKDQKMERTPDRSAEILSESNQEHENDNEINHHLHDSELKITNNSFTAQMNALGMMPVAGESGAVGYGVITEKGTDAVVVSTTHGGVLDSELQKDASDPVWHNHVVKLGKVELCGENPGVIDITFESPGEAAVKENGLVMVNVPENFSGTHSLNKSKLTFDYGTDIKSVVQFQLQPKFDDKNTLQAVCVTNIEEIPFEII